MKFTSTLIITIFYFCTSLGQIQYSHYIDSTSQWYQKNYSSYYTIQCNNFVDVYGEITYFIAGDTTFGGKVYHKVYAYGKDSLVCPTSGSTINYHPTVFHTGIREDSLKKIYGNDGFGEILYWDFNVNLGDTITTQNGSCPISLIDTLWLGIIPLKRFHCNCLSNNKIIEGVGAYNGFFSPLLCVSQIESSRRLVCYKKQNDVLHIDSSEICTFAPTFSNSKTLIHNEKFEILDLFPNPTQNSFWVKVNSPKNSIIEFKIINTLGHIIQTKKSYNFINEIDISILPKGIYFLQISSNETRKTTRIIKK